MLLLLLFLLLLSAVDLFGPLAQEPSALAAVLRVLPTLFRCRRRRRSEAAPRTLLFVVAIVVTTVLLFLFRLLFTTAAAAFGFLVKFCGGFVGASPEVLRELEELDALGEPVPPLCQHAACEGHARRLRQVVQFLGGKEKEKKNETGKEGWTHID